MSESPSAPAHPMPKAYVPADVEDRIYALWEELGAFQPHSNANGKAFVIIMPPPNVTGALHLGHALTMTVEDCLVRWHRMLGEETLWLPGVDHAGIATQNVVEAEIAREGLSRHDLGRDAFLEHVWDWVGRYRPRIEHQLRKIGASCDWSRLTFTLDPGPQRSVRATFVQLHADGKIYRGPRIINWCPRCRTALSDLEVDYEDEPGHLWHVRYGFVDAAGTTDGDGVVIATTRPETIVADVAIAVNPEDDRWRDLSGQRVRVPIPGFDREIPVIADASVEIGFGTGALKITPGHDMLDFEIGERHGLEAITAIDWDGRMSEAAGPYAGMDRDDARRKSVDDLTAAGALVKTEDHPHSVGHCHRCNTIVEPLLSTQWFVDTTELAAQAAAVANDGRMRIVPDRFAKIYLQWIENIRPWCISRQLWWGHRIPAWYCLRCDADAIQVTLPAGGENALPQAGNVTELLAQGVSYATIQAASEITVDASATAIVRLQPPSEDGCPRCKQGPLLQDPDVLDTWFSSGLWPHSTLGWPPETPEQERDLARYYPSSVMVTGYDILFFWVARMVMMGCNNMGGVPPFETVYLHGLVRDAEGRKMSKSLPNSIDPLEAGEQYGMDALRFTLATGSTPGNDMRLADERLEGGRNFANKLWNGARFVLGELSNKTVLPPRLADRDRMTLEDRWILSRLAQLTEHVDRLMSDFHLGEAGRQIYDFLWTEFFDWYVEASKVRLRNNDPSPLPILAHVLDHGLRLLHPLMPFVTEELWHQLNTHLEGRDLGENPSLIMARYPQPDPAWIDQQSDQRFLLIQDIVRAIRQIRADRAVENHRWVEVYVISPGNIAAEQISMLEILARARPLHLVKDRANAPSDQVVTQVLDLAEVVLPLGGLVDLGRERQRLAKKIAETETHLQRVEGKLANAGFRSKAPMEVVVQEERRRDEIRGRLDGLRTRFAELG